jgi:hypothetical protein
MAYVFWTGSFVFISRKIIATCTSVIFSYLSHYDNISEANMFMM